MAVDVALTDSLPASAAAPRETPTFEQIVLDHQDRILRLAHRLLGWSQDADAEDVLQEVFLTVYRKLATFRGEGPLAAWLAALTVHQCRTQQRRRMLRRRLSLGIWARREVTTSVAVDHPLQESERSAAVRNAVRALPDRDREVVVLRYFEELPLGEIAQALGIAVNAVEVRLHRARAKLEQKLMKLREE